MLVDYSKAIAPYIEERKKMKVPNPSGFTVKEYLDTILDIINKKCADGYRFNGFLYTTNLSGGGALIFEKTEMPCKYTYKFANKITEEISKSRKRGKIVSDINVLAMYEDLGDIHAIMTGSNAIKEPVFFIKLEDDSLPQMKTEKLDLYDLYQKETKKNAVFHGKETKGFQEWLKEKNKNEQA